jgi:arsenate reductase (glutaredoxin)
MLKAVTMTLQVYGIPSCGTCKKALQWLEDRNISYAFINTKEQPPTRELVEVWVEALGEKPLRNTSGQSYRALGDAKQDWSAEQWVEAFAQDAMLIKRPVFVKDGKPVMAGFRASEAVLQEVLG